jgi:hypothetical protein
VGLKHQKGLANERTKECELHLDCVWGQLPHPLKLHKQEGSLKEQHEMDSSHRGAAMFARDGVVVVL